MTGGATEDRESRAGAALDRIVGGLVNSGITAWLTAATGEPTSAMTVGSMLGPLAEELSHGLRVLIDIREGRVAYVMQEAAGQTGLDAGDLLHHCLKDPAKVELFVRTLDAAAHSTSTRKLKLLAHLFTTGALAEDGTIVDEQVLATDSIAQLDRPHFRLLDVIRKPSPTWWEEPATRTQMRWAWHESRIVEDDPGLRNALPALTSKLESLGMVREVRRPDLNDGRIWELTGFGHLCTEALRAIGNETDGLTH